MDKAKRAALKKQGWRIGSTQEFLGLTDEEVAYIELKLNLGHKLKASRLDRNLSQVELARLVNSSQSRVAKMEAGDPSVSADLIIKSLLALGVSRKELGRTILTHGD